MPRDPHRACSTWLLNMDGRLARRDESVIKLKRDRARAANGEVRGAIVGSEVRHDVVATFEEDIKEDSGNAGLLASRRAN